jgi:hydroxymethylbilane synthase
VAGAEKARGRSTCSRDDGHDRRTGARDENPGYPFHDVCSETKKSDLGFAWLPALQAERAPRGLVTLEVLRSLRLGTRGSRLALAQSRLVAERIRARGIAVEIVTIVSDGDLRAPDAPIGEGIFVTALERALKAGDIDLAVHSAKDLPLDEDPDTIIVAYPERGDARDVLVARRDGLRLEELPKRAKVGTDSPRRAGFLRAVRPDLDVISIHGNVDTRLQRLDSGQAHALVLAAAGLDRLGYGARASVRMEVGDMPPAPGQGALAVQVRRGDAAAASLLAPLDDASVRSAVVAERALLKAMRGGCRAPVGAFAHIEEGLLMLLAGAVTADGRTRHLVYRAIAGAGLARSVLAVADELNRNVRLQSRTVLDTRPELDRDFADAADLMGFRHVHVPAMEIGASADSRLDAARRELATFDWVVVTSRRGVNVLLDGLTPGPGPRWAAVGASTAEALEAHGVAVDVVPDEAEADALPEAIARVADLRGARVLLARADAAAASLPLRLRELGAEVDDVVAYTTSVGPDASREAMVSALDDPDLEAVIFASGSAVRGVLALAGGDAARMRASKIITIGPRTSAAVREAGYEVTREARTRDSAGLATALKSALDDEVTEWVESQLRLPV